MSIPAKAVAPAPAVLPDPPRAGVTVREILGVPAMLGATVTAGADGMDRVVRQLNVMEVPDVVPWTKPGELLLTTGYPLREDPAALTSLVVQLDERGLAGLALKLGRYLDDLPPGVAAEADRRGFPLVLLPADVGFDDVLTQGLTLILRAQSAELTRAEDVHRTLVEIVLDGGGLPELAGRLVPLLGGGAVLITTADGRVLEHAGDGQALDRLATAGAVDGSGRLRTERLRDGLSPVGGTSLPAACVRIVAGSLDHGRIVALAGDRPHTEADVATLQQAATVAALAITKAQAVAAVESKYQDDFLRDLLTGRATDLVTAGAHAVSLGWRLDRPCVVVVADIDPGQWEGVDTSVPRASGDRFATAWRGVVRQTDREAAVGSFSGEVAAVVGAPQAEDVDRLVRSLVARVSGDSGGGRLTFSTGVSRVVPGLAGLAQGYEQARKAVRVARQVDGPGSFAHFDSLGVHRLLSLIPDQAEVQAFVRETLHELADDSDPEHEDLRHTLEVLLATNGNVAESARRLHYHYNTLRYRIGKLERMLGPFTADADLRLSLLVALQAQRMRGR